MQLMIVTFSLQVDFTACSHTVLRATPEQNK